MRYIIYGAGAIGGTIGARLHLSGEKVILIARGAHLDQLRKEGMTFRSPEGKRQLSIPVVNHPAEIEFEPGDVVFFTMKSQHSMEAMDSLCQFAGPDIPVICCQNGVANEFTALRWFTNTYAMVVMLPASHIRAGEIVHHASNTEGNRKGGILDAGRFPCGSDETINTVARDLNRAGFSCEVDDRIMRWKYAKLLQNLGNALQALAGLDNSVQDAARKDIVSQMIHEALACYKAAGIECADRDEVASRRKNTLEMEDVEGFERGGGSSWQSLLRGADSIETNYLNGEISWLGRLHGIPTPANETLRRLALQVVSEGQVPGSYTADQIRDLIKLRQSSV